MHFRTLVKYFLLMLSAPENCFKRVQDSLGNRCRIKSRLLFLTRNRLSRFSVSSATKTTNGFIFLKKIEIMNWLHSSFYNVIRTLQMYKDHLPWFRRLWIFFSPRSLTILSFFLSFSSSWTQQADLIFFPALLPLLKKQLQPL